MRRYALDLWARALDSLTVAEAVLRLSPDRAASSAYYAAFYAVSAHFALQEASFKKHKGLAAAVHRDLVKAGLWPESLGADYTSLMNERTIADYGVCEHVMAADAAATIVKAKRILAKVQQLHPDVFSLPPSGASQSANP